MPRDDKGKALKSRRENYKGPFPNAGRFEYIFGYLTESGILTSWQEIKAWQETTCTHLQPYESELMFKMSNAHVHQLQISTDIGCPAPWFDAESIDHKQVGDRLKKALRSLK